VEKTPRCGGYWGWRGCKSKKKIACTRCTETIRMLNKEEMEVVVGCEGGRAQQQKCTEGEWCDEGTWHIEHKRQKNKKNKECAEDIDADREVQCSRTMMRPVSH
jgi:hypothetical protein